MKSNLPKKLFTLASILLLGILATQPALARRSRVQIRGNGAGSTNHVRIRNHHHNSCNHYNYSQIFNHTSSQSNTGSNTANTNTATSTSVQTGDIQSYAFIYTGGNHNTLHCQPKPSPTPPACQQIQVWANGVVAANQGTLKSGDPITDPARTNPNSALGAPDGAFFSLGKTGSLTVTFATPVIDKSGVDLSFHEITNDRDVYPQENATVEVSANGTTWFDVGSISNQAGGDGVDFLDISSSGLSEISFVRLTDSTNYSIHDDLADGYDVDAIDAFSQTCHD